MTRPVVPALALLALPLVGAIAGPHFFSGDLATTIASVTPTSPPATAAPVPDSPAPGHAPAGVESGTENATPTGVIGDPAFSVVEYATVGETADRLAQVAVGLPPVPPAPHPAHLVVDGDCESWRPLLESYGIPYDEARPIMWRESRCTMAVNYNPRTRDDSVCAFQLNRWGALDAAWNSAGFTRDYMSTPEGCIAAVAFYYEPCGWGPWTKPYSCPGGWPL